MFQKEISPQYLSLYNKYLYLYDITDEDWISNSAIENYFESSDDKSVKHDSNPVAIGNYIENIKFSTKQT